MASYLRRNSTSGSTAVPEKFRRELRDFQVYHASMRAEEEKKSKKDFDELSNATKRRFETSGSRNDPTTAIQRDDAIERAALTKDLENRIGSRAREEWYARLGKAGLAAEQWTDVTPAENDVLSGLLWGRNDSVPVPVSFNDERSAHTPNMSSRGPQLWTPPESARAELPAPNATASNLAQGQRVAYNNTPAIVTQPLPELLKSPHVPNVPLQSIYSPPQPQSQALPQTHPRRNTVASSAPAQAPSAPTNTNTTSSRTAAPSAAIPQDAPKAHSRSKGPAAQLSDVTDDDQDTETELTYKAHISSRKSASVDSKVAPIRAEPPKAQPQPKASSASPPKASPAALSQPPSRRAESIQSTTSINVGIPFPTPPESTLTSSVPLPSQTEPDAEWKALLRSRIEEKLRPVINDARAHNNHDLSDMSSIAEGLYQDELAQERKRLVDVQTTDETRMRSDGGKQKVEEQKPAQKRAASPPTTQKASASQPIVQKPTVPQPTVQKQAAPPPVVQKQTVSQPPSQKPVVTQPTAPKQAVAQAPVQKSAVPQPSVQKQASPPTPAQKHVATPTQKVVSPPVQKQAAPQAPVQKQTVSQPTTQKQPSAPTSKPAAPPAQKPASPTALKQASPATQKPTTTPTQRPTATPAQKPPSPTALKQVSSPTSKPTPTPAQKPVSPPVQKSAAPQAPLQKQAVPQKPVVSQPISQKPKAPQLSTQKPSVPQTPIQKQAAPPPVQKQAAPQKPVAPTAPSSESKTTEQITPPPTPGTRYIGPELTSEEKDKEEAAFDAFLLEARKQKIVEFHQAAAMMEVELADELHTHRLVGSQLKAVLKKHDNDMLKLKERMEQERKVMCDAEKARRVAELGALSRDARSTESEDSQNAQKTRSRSDTIRPNRPEDQAERSRSAATDASGQSLKMSSTAASSAEMQKVSGSPPTNASQAQIPPTPTFSPRALESTLTPTSFAVIEKRDEPTFVPPTPQNSPRPLESPRKATALTLPVGQQYSPPSFSESSLGRIPPTPHVVGRSLIDEPMVTQPSTVETSPRRRQEQLHQSGAHQFSNITPVTPSMTLPQIYDSLSTDDEEDIKGSVPIALSRKQVRFTPSAVGGNSDSDSDLNSDSELDERARALRNTLGLGAGYDARVNGERRAGYGDAVSRSRKRGPSRAPTATPLIGKMELPEIWYPPPEEKTMGRGFPGAPGSPLPSPHQNWNEWS